MSTFENVEMFAACERVFSKLSNDTNLLKIELQLLNILEQDGGNFVILSLYFTSYFAQYL